MRVAIHYHRFIVGGIERVILHQLKWLDSLDARPLLILDQAPDGGNSFPIPDYVDLQVLPKSPEERRQKLLSVCNEQDVRVYIEHFYHDILKPNSRILEDLKQLGSIKGLGRFLWWHAEYTYSGVSVSLDDRRRTVHEKLCPVLDGICCLSRVDAAFFTSCGIRSRFVPNETGLTCVSSSNTDSGSLRNILWLARLDRDKYPFDALEIFAMVHKRMPEVTFTMVGGGEPDMENRLKARATALGLGPDCLEMTGVRNDVDAFYEKASVFLMTSGHEGFAITLVEAASRGLPVVSYAIPQAEPLRMNRGAIQVPQRDVEKASDVLVALLEDAGRYKQARVDSLAAYRKLSTFDYVGLYRSMIDGRFSGEPSETAEDRRLVSVLAESRWNPLVSIIVPVFNTEKYLKACLDSLSDQQYRNIEIICVDDGSTDSSNLILADSAKADGRFKVLTQQNSGQGAARNRALGIASGRYVYFMDSDDCLEQGAIGDMVALMENDKLDQLIFSSSVFSDEPQTPELIKTIAGFEHYYEPPQERTLRKILRGSDLFKRLLAENKFTVSPPLRMIRREIIETNGIRFPEGYIHEDWGFTPIALLKSDRAEFVPNRYYRRRVRCGSTMTATDAEAEQRHFMGYVNALTALYVSPCVEKDFTAGDRTGLLALASLAKTVGYKGSSCLALLLSENQERVAENRASRALEFKGDEKSLVSVILPINNVSPYLDKCLDSIERQTYSNLEIICVDDGSTDDSLSVVRRHEEHDSRYKVLQTAQNGAGAARNRGLAIAGGEYVFFHDPDDFSDTNLIGEAVARANRTHADVVLWGRYSYDSQSEKITATVNLPASVRALPETFSYADASQLSLVNFGFAPWNKLVRRSFLAAHGIKFQEIPRNNDVYFSSAVVLRADRISVLGAPYYYYRINRKGGLQDTIDSTPLTTFQALSAVRQCIKNTGRESAFMPSFIKQAFSECIVKLCSFNGVEAVNAFYCKLRTDGFSSLGIDDESIAALGIEDRELYALIVREERPDRFLLDGLKKYKNAESECQKQIQELRRQLASARSLQGNGRISMSQNLNDLLTTYRLDCQTAFAEFSSVVPIATSEGVSVASPAWLRGNGKDGVCVTCAEQISSFSLKCQCAGTLLLALRGTDVRTLDGKDRLPFYVDYTSIKVNGKEMLKGLTSVWHDRPHKFTIKAKAGEVIKIEVETEPHVYEREVLKDLLLKAKLPFKVEPGKIDALLDDPMLRMFLPDPPTAFQHLLASWRVDCCFAKSSVGALSVDTENTNLSVTSPDWMQRNNQCGLCFTASESTGKVVFTSKGAGTVRLELRGLNVGLKGGKGRAPFYADYVSVKVRGKELLPARTAVWHDQPAVVTFRVKAGERVEVNILTAPHIYTRAELKDLLMNAWLPFAVPTHRVDTIVNNPLMIPYLSDPHMAEVTMFKERHAADVKKIADEQHTISVLKERLAKLEAQVAAQVPAASSKIVDEANKRTEAARREVQKLKRETAARAKEVAELRESESYKVGMAITKPARAIKRALKHLRGKSAKPAQTK